ncbi:hypothetical protein DFP93_10256 [Aneurinibacillus soli]|uniref:Uncharacterized protein n=1 Tax=Aneurinibacillus soli TaxID=1500254 RepID=A0A0U5AVC3_9BACL|nr:FapA family protein [Aneurinibacillus soli]PYE63372.1 hypothetical protein DFP93_10256 [Aneurinibacillus soli]BAU27697.1 hypothetical protein CB4_01871 [Aneurinibacillus soli]
MEDFENEKKETSPPKTFADVAKIQIAKDKLTAVMEFDIEEGMTFTYDEVVSVLEKNKVYFGRDEELLRKVAESPRSYSHENLTVAHGSAPVHGIDGKIEYMIHSSGKTGPQEKEDGNVDYYNVLTLLNVSKGQMLAKKIPATKGTPGKSVTGDEIVAKDGKEARYQIGKNVLLDQEKVHAYAAIDGQVSITDKGKLNVLSVYEVKGDLDFSVGNIDFVGSVVVRGNVHPGFTVKAGGDIRIAGSVEGATLEANGTIEIAQGVIGQNKGYIKAGHDVKAGFIQDALVTAENDVIISQVIMHSNVSAGHQVICRATKGLIVGGSIKAGESVLAKIVGNATNTPTSIEVGVKPQLREELQNLKKEVKEHTASVLKADQGLRFLDQLAMQGKLTADKKAMQIKFTNSKLLSEKKLAQSKERLREIEEMLSGMQSARVECSGIMYSGTKLVFGSTVRFIKENYSRSAFYLGEDGQVTSTIL